MADPVYHAARCYALDWIVMRFIVRLFMNGRKSDEDWLTPPCLFADAQTLARSVALYVTSEDQMTGEPMDTKGTVEIPRPPYLGANTAGATMRIVDCGDQLREWAILCNGEVIGWTHGSNDFLQIDDQLYELPGADLEGDSFQIEMFDGKPDDEACVGDLRPFVE